MYLCLFVLLFCSKSYQYTCTSFGCALANYHRDVTRLTRRVSLVEQKLLTLQEHPSSPLVFSGVRVTRSLVLYVCFVDRCLSLCTFSFGHCVVCSSSIYGFWLPLWYLQTLLLVISNQHISPDVYFSTIFQYYMAVQLMRRITLCDKVCQWLATGRWFSLGTRFPPTDRHDITEI